MLERSSNTHHPQLILFAPILVQSTTFLLIKRSLLVIHKISLPVTKVDSSSNPSTLLSSKLAFVNEGAVGVLIPIGGCRDAVVLAVDSDAFRSLLSSANSMLTSGGRSEYLSLFSSISDSLLDDSSGSGSRSWYGRMCDT